MWKSLASNGLSLILVLLVALGGVIGWGQRAFHGEGPLEAPICLLVDRGATIDRVSAKLVEQGAVSDDRIFRLGANYTNKASQLKYGSYLIPAQATMGEILEIVTTAGASTCGTSIIYRIGITSSEVVVRELDPVSQTYSEIASFDPAGDETIPAGYAEKRAAPDSRYEIEIVPGVTSWQVVDALARADFLDGDVEEVPAEGALAPGNYEVSVSDARADVLLEMATRQERILATAWEARQEGLPVETPEEALILASIIEKETGLPDERRTVAAVFSNRLDLGMRLQTDPTVIYGITEGKGILGRGLRQSELRRQTPYNTYVIDGLPPTPIANPGRASIEAALNPDESEYLFFVADGTGGHAFATTLDEHNINVRKWRQIEIERRERELREATESE